MNRTSLKFLLTFLLLVPAQALVFNHLVLFGTAVPLVFIYLIIILPVTLGTNLSVAAGFLTGLCVDIFSDTPGVNALSCTILAFARKPIFHLYVSMDDDLAGRMPSLRAMGHAEYFKYISTMVFLYCVLVFSIEAFQFFIFRLLVLRTVTSAIYTILLIYAIDSLTISRRENKL